MPEAKNRQPAKPSSQPPRGMRVNSPKTSVIQTATSGSDVSAITTATSQATANRLAESRSDAISKRANSKRAAAISRNSAPSEPSSWRTSANSGCLVELLMVRRWGGS